MHFRAKQGLLSIFNQKKVKGIFLSEVVQVRLIFLWFESIGGTLMTKEHSCAQNHPRRLQASVEHDFLFFAYTQPYLGNKYSER